MESSGPMEESPWSQSDGNALMNDSLDEALFEQTIGSNGKWTKMKRFYLHLQTNVWELNIKLEDTMRKKSAV